MKSQRIPEHKLNVTNTIGQVLENIEYSNSIETEKTKNTKVTQVHSNEAK
jgi:hypothetical protein